MSFYLSMGSLVSDTWLLGRGMPLRNYAAPLNFAGTLRASLFRDTLTQDFPHISLSEIPAVSTVLPSDVFAVPPGFKDYCCTAHHPPGCAFETLGPGPKALNFVSHTHCCKISGMAPHFAPNFLPFTLLSGRPLWVGSTSTGLGDVFSCLLLRSLFETETRVALHFGTSWEMGCHSGVVYFRKLQNTMYNL